VPPLVACNGIESSVCMWLWASYMQQTCWWSCTGVPMGVGVADGAGWWWCVCVWGGVPPYNGIESPVCMWLWALYMQQTCWWSCTGVNQEVGVAHGGGWVVGSEGWGVPP
jgi:hypothetical protein